MKMKIIGFGLLFVMILAGLSTWMQVSKNQKTNRITPTPSIPRTQEVLESVGRTMPPEFDSTPFSAVTVTPVAASSAGGLSPQKKEIILEKYEQNYPYRARFPYTSKTLFAHYELEPKKLYIESKLSLENSLAELDTYLHTFGAKIELLKIAGVVFSYTQTQNVPESRRGE